MLQQRRREDGDGRKRKTKREVEDTAAKSKCTISVQVSSVRSPAHTPCEQIRPSRPLGDLIDRIHRLWWGDYKKLEAHHGFIQWLFPLFEGEGMNYQSSRLTKGEGQLPETWPPGLSFLLLLPKTAQLMRESIHIAMRIVKSYQLMVLSPRPNTILSLRACSNIVLAFFLSFSSTSMAYVWLIGTRAKSTEPGTGGLAMPT